MEKKPPYGIYHLANEGQDNYFNFVQELIQTLGLKKEIMEEHDLTIYQMNWRRHTLMNKCGGDEDKFKQEYPLTPDEAFITSGKRVFKEILTKPQEKNICKPRCHGNHCWRYQDC